MADRDPRASSRISRRALLGAAALVAAAPRSRAADGPHLVIDVRLAPDAHRLEIGVTPPENVAAPPGAREVRTEAGELRYSVISPDLDKAREGRLTSFIDPRGSLVFDADWAPRVGGGFTYELRLRTPAAQRAASSGRLVEERVEHGERLARYVPAGPAQDLTIAAGPLEAGTSEAGGFTARTLFPAPLEPRLGRAYRAQVLRHLERYSALIGPYPHGLFQVVAVPVPVGLGFPSFTVVAEQILPLPFMQGRSLAHEILHAWWGNGIEPDYAAGNWAEALTTFMADYALAEAESADAARDMRYRWLSDFAVLAPADDVPLASFRERRHSASQAVGYGKGAMLFLMLRDMLGDAAFHEGLRRFWAEWRFKRASWGALRQSFEAASGARLGAFFDAWVGRAGAPRLRLAEAAATPDGLRFTLAQEAPRWTLRLPVRVTTDAGEEWHEVPFDSPTQSFALSTGAPARALAVDPDFRVFRRLGLDETAPTIRSVAVAPDVAAAAAGPVGAGVAGMAVQAFLEGGGAVADAGPARAVRRPLLLVGTRDEVAVALPRLGLPARPDFAGGAASSAVAWAARYDGGVPLLVVEGDSGPALAALLARLRHYGSESWIAFDGTRVTGRGLLPPAARPLHATLR